MNLQAPSGNGQRWAKIQLFLLSGTALFLELMVIRWVPSVIKLIAYYANLMLLSSFLGLGLGALASARKWRLFEWFPLFLAADLGVILVCRPVAMGAAGTELRFGASVPGWANYLALGGIFLINTLLFVPLGQRMGRLFDSLPRLAAYGWDLGGSLCGTLGFALFSLKLFSPLVGIGVVMTLYVIVSPVRRWPVTLACFAGLAVLLVATRERAAFWSPYYHITVTSADNPRQPLTAPPPQLRTMRDPPVYTVKVNQFGYHYDATLNLARYTPGTPLAALVASLADQYRVPYALGARRDRVLVVGAGGGNDVEAALAAGARHVDAVEIDPVVVALSRRFNAGAPFDDPRVTVHVDDARVFLARARGGYDLVVFGFLDSQALFSSRTNVRLDGFVYTVEGLRTAYGLVRDGGLLSLSFFAGQNWLIPKLYRMAAEATGRTPLLYLHGQTMILCVSKGIELDAPNAIFRFRRAVFGAPPKIEPATDDWPYLYLSKKSIPGDYVVAIGGLLALSLALIAVLGPRRYGRPDAFFALLGMGFMLLETKSIADCTLYFGTTWFVTMAVVAGILVMVLAANGVAARLPRFSPWLYVPLIAALLLLAAMPRGPILRQGFSGRLLWTLVAVPLPVFFAGLIFSTNFRDSARPALRFGANLIGAMVGGFSEYLGMLIGSNRLSLLVIAVYLASLAVALGSRRGHPPGAPIFPDAEEPAR